MPTSSDDRSVTKHDGLIIGTRRSKLAMWQAQHVESLLTSLPGGCSMTTSLSGINSEGDTNQSLALSKFTSKGVFTKELDVALLSNPPSISVAVHSLKDVPTVLEPGLRLAAVLTRAPCHDVIVLSDKYDSITSLDNLPCGSIIGTSSLRRRAILSHVHPHLTFADLRGNIQTRLAKLQSGLYDGICLAAAGLIRLDLDSLISINLDPTVYPYAVSQGAIAVICREDDDTTFRMISQLDDRETSWCCAAERSLLRSLEGGCKVPVGVRSVFNTESSVMTLYACVISIDGLSLVESTMDLIVDTIHQAELLGSKVGDKIRQAGGATILEEIRLNDI